MGYQTEVWITVGGSHRQYEKDKRKLTAAGIEHRWVGPVAYKSKLSCVAIKIEDEPKAKELGFHRSRTQPTYP